MRIKLLILIFISTSSIEIYSQVNQEWIARYNGPGNNVDEATCISVSSTGNVYVAGESYGGSITQGDYVTIKYNNAGVLQWVQQYNGSANSYDRIYSIAVDNSENVYVTGESWDSTSIYDYATIKYNSQGVMQWLQRYNGPGNSADNAHSIVVDGSGNVYVTGTSLGNGTWYDYATIKYNSAGVQQWVSRYNGPLNDADNARSIVVDASGNVYVTGTSLGSGTGYDYVTIKYNSAGVQMWVSRYNGTGNGLDDANSIKVDPESSGGNVYVTGSSTGSGTFSDYVTIKYNSSGVQQWVSRYNGPGNDVDNATSLALDSSGNVYITGYSTGIGSGFDYATVKYDSQGVQQWVQRYNGPGSGSDNAYSIAMDGSGNVYVTGSSVGIGTYYDYATIKYNSSGVQQWVQRYNGPQTNGGDNARSIVLDGSSNVYVTGESPGTGTGNDCLTIKYSQSIGIHSISSEIPKNYSLSQNFPNPFNPNTKLSFSIMKNGYTKLIVYDYLAREVVTLVNEQLQPGIYEIEWGADNISCLRRQASGVYYYKLISGEYAETKKMILLK